MHHARPSPPTLGPSLQALPAICSTDHRMALLLEADTRTSAAAARKMFVAALDWLQIVMQVESIFLQTQTSTPQA